MPSENVLVQFTTAANLAGIDALKASMFGLNAQTLGLAALLFGLYETGKAGVDNFKKQQVASGELTQAYATQKDTLAAHRAEIDRFLNTNAKFISDQYDTQEALASIIRAGFDTKDALHILGDALDLAAIKHIPVTDAEKTLILAFAGNKRGLKELGITSEEYDKIMKSKTLTTAQKHAALLKLIEGHTKDGTAAIDENQRKQNELNKHWQDFTSKTGPGILKVWDKLIEAADTFVQLLDLTVQFLGKMAQLSPKAGSADTGQLGSVSPFYQHRASGGPVGPGGAYTVGEHGPETLVMGDQGGGIIPAGAGGGVHLHIHGGVFMDNGPTLDALANTLIRHARFRPGT